MNCLCKFLPPLSFGFLLFISCNSKKQESKYSEIFSKPPFEGLTDSINKEPSNDELYFRRAVLLNTNDLAEPALEDFKKAWSLKKNEKYAFGYSNILLEQKPDSAIAFLNEALAQLPGSFLLKLTLARALVSKDKTEEALAIVNKMLAENPQQVDVMKMKADILEKQGDEPQSISVLQTAHHIAPFDVELNYMLALRLAESKNPGVLALCDSLIKADSLGIHAEPFYYKGIYYSALNDKNKAISFFDQAIKRDYYFLDGYIEKGALLYELKKFPDALAVFNLCLTVSPKFADAYYWIAKCQEATGNPAEAKTNYERAFSLDNKLIEAKTAADKLK